MGFFYDPNIHPYSEYQLRLLDVRRSCKKLDIELLEGEYDFANWIEAVRGLEMEPEKGKRCEACFDFRFQRSAQKALELGEKKVTTTLLVSPLKSQEQLKLSGEKFFQEHGVEFIAFDYRADGGTQLQSKVAKEEQLYRQDYCGCIYGLSMQREQQQKLMDEMFSHVAGQIQPASIEERLELYASRNSIEDEQKTYKILKQKFLNYRQFSLKLTINKNTITPSYALFYSTLPRKKTEGSVDFSHKDVYYLNRDEIKFITIKTFNALSGLKYQNTTELIFTSPTVEIELQVRTALGLGSYDLTPIIVVDDIPQTKVTIELDATTYEDTKEQLIIL